MPTKLPQKPLAHRFTDFRPDRKNGNILKTYVGEPNFSQLYQEIDQALAQ